jgi:hypothetical protein
MGWWKKLFSPIQNALLGAPAYRVVFCVYSEDGNEAQRFECAMIARPTSSIWNGLKVLLSEAEETARKLALTKARKKLRLWLCHVPGSSVARIQTEMRPPSCAGSAAYPGEIEVGGCLRRSVVSFAASPNLAPRQSASRRAKVVLPT